MSEKDHTTPSDDESDEDTEKQSPPENTAGPSGSTPSVEHDAPKVEQSFEVIKGPGQSVARAEQETRPVDRKEKSTRPVAPEEEYTRPVAPEEKSIRPVAPLKEDQPHPHPTVIMPQEISDCPPPREIDQAKFALVTFNDGTYTY